jgi:raffinose/stachyose/melibiose transport system permease protein
MWFLFPALLINLLIILIPALLTVAMAFVSWDGTSDPVFPRRFSTTSSGPRYS